MHLDQPLSSAEITENYVRSITTSDIPDSPIDDDGADQIEQMMNELGRLQIQIGDNFKDTFLGKSSCISLMNSTFMARERYAGSVVGFKPRRPKIEFLKTEPWERGSSDELKHSNVFPRPDLLDSLTVLYFSNVNLFFPLLHRPSFERSVSVGTHEIDNEFADIVLLVCAIASRYSVDERVKVDGIESWHSAGWKWFNQVKYFQRPMYVPVTLNDLQVCCLHVLFLYGTCSPRRCWLMVGLGIRLSQEIGAHRRRKDRNNMTLEDELLKRAFWILVSIDRVVCANFGRPCAIQDEDFDVDFPIECDDEYWVSKFDICQSEPFTDSTQKIQLFPKQPLEKPSIVTSFVVFLKLNQILATVLRTVYSIKKSKTLFGFVGPDWEQQIVSELDSALNRWVYCMPSHLRWEPIRENEIFFKQSAFLYCFYYHVQILVHRPFIPTPGKPSTTSFPSLSICNNAARAFSQVIDVERKQVEMAQYDEQINLGFVVPPPQQMAISTVGLVLLLNIWTGKKYRSTISLSNDIAYIHKCMDALKALRARWATAGKLLDFFSELLSAGDLPLPSSPLSSIKTEHVVSPPLKFAPESYTVGVSADTGIPYSDRIGQLYAFGETQQPTADWKRMDQNHQQEYEWHSLPTFSNELGGTLYPAGQIQTHWQPRSLSLPTGNPGMYSREEAQITFPAHPSITTFPFFSMSNESATFYPASVAVNNRTFPLVSSSSEVETSSDRDPRILLNQDMISTMPRPAFIDERYIWEGYLSNMEVVGQSFGGGG